MRLIDGQAVAEFLGCSRSAVRMWALRGDIVRAGIDHRGRALYDVDAVLRLAETRGYAPACTTP